MKESYGIKGENMKINNEFIEKSEEYLKNAFDSSQYLMAHPSDREYRLQHSYRVANIGKIIAKKEGFDIIEMVIGCLLHDISYSEEFKNKNDWLNHGRNSAKIVRPFLLSLGLNKNCVDDICYGIAIHVDDKADFEGNPTAFATTIGDSDNIDRFDVYRIYETLEYNKFSQMTFDEKNKKVNETLKRLKEYIKMQLGTKTATEMWKERIQFYISFYEKLKEQLCNSTSIY